MKIISFVLLSFLLTLTFFSCAKEVGKVNFSGTWNLNRDMSDLGFAEGGERGQGRTGDGGERDQGRTGDRGDRGERGGRGGGFGNMVIKQEGNILTIDRSSRNRDGEEITRKTEWTLDGKEFQTEGFGGGTQTSTAKWTNGGTALTVTTNAYFERNGQEFEMNSNEIWHLEDNGTVLVIEAKRSTPRGERTTRMVYDKAE